MNDSAEKMIFKQFNKTIWSKLHKAIKEYELIQQGDRIAVCISGGKDSMLMAKCLQLLERQGFCGISCEYIVMDPGYSSENMGHAFDVHCSIWLHIAVEVVLLTLHIDLQFLRAEKTSALR